MTRVRATAAAAALLLATAAPGVRAQDGVTRVEVQRADLASAEGTEVIMATLDLAPGAVVPRHSHNGEEFLFVISGGPMKAPDGSVVEFADGMALHFERGQVHGGLSVAGDATVRLLTVHVVDKGKPLTVPAE